MSAHKFFTHTCRKCKLTFRLILRPDRAERMLMRCPDCRTKVWLDNTDGGLQLQRTRLLSRPIREYDLKPGIDYVAPPPELTEPPVLESLKAPALEPAEAPVLESVEAPATDTGKAAGTRANAAPAAMPVAADHHSQLTAEGSAGELAEPDPEEAIVPGRLRLTFFERLALLSEAAVSQIYLLRYRLRQGWLRLRAAVAGAVASTVGGLRRAGAALLAGLGLVGTLLIWPVRALRQFAARAAQLAGRTASGIRTAFALSMRSAGHRLRRARATGQARLQDWRDARATAAEARRTEQAARLRARQAEETARILATREQAARAAAAREAADRDAAAIQAAARLHEQEARQAELAAAAAATNPLPAPQAAISEAEALQQAVAMSNDDAPAPAPTLQQPHSLRAALAAWPGKLRGLRDRFVQQFKTGRLRWLWPRSVSPRWLMLGYAATPIAVFALYLLASFAFPGLALPESMAVFEARLQPVRANRIVDRDGGLIAELFARKTSNLELQANGKLDARVPDSLKDMLLFVEDGSFYEHQGVRPLAILRAFTRNVLAGRYVEGGSTITQQVARIALRRRDRSLRRKFQEAVLSRQLEVELSKNEILNAYLNHVYMGHGAYGMQVAAGFYFQRPLSELNFAEQLMLVTLLPAPAEFSPLRNPARLEQRMDLLYARMVSEQFPRVAAYKYRRQKNALFASVLDLSPNQSVFASRANHAPYVAEYVRIALKDLARAYNRRGSGPNARAGVFATDSADRGPAFDRLPRFRLPADLRQNEIRRRSALLETGATVETTIDPMLQRAATVETPRFISEVNPRFPPRRIVDGKAVRPSGVREALGQAYEESRLGLEILGYQAPPRPVPHLQAAAIGVRPSTGAVLFMQGGAGFRAGNQLNHAIAMRRQTGSAIKPFIYAAAIASGRANPATVLDDKPYPKAGPGPEEDPEWKPRNYKDDYHGRVSVRFALEQSLNIPTIRVAERTGMDRIANQFRRVFFPAESSFQKRFRRDLTVAIGSLEMSPLEMAVAYSAFGNNGTIQRPYLITRVVARDGTVLFERPPVDSRAAANNGGQLTARSALNAAAASIPKSSTQIDTEYAPETNGDEFGLRIPGQRRVMTGDVAHVMASLLKDSAKRGGAGYWSRFTLGKTGTSNHYRDAWFVGVLPDVSAAVWVGYDQPSNSMGRATGAAVAGPLWARIVASGMYGRSPGEFHFEPRGRFYHVCTRSGGRARASCPHTRREIFAREHVPARCWKHE